MVTSTAWQRVATFSATVLSHPSLPRSRRCPVATVRQTVEVFLVTSTAWQRMATFSAAVVP